MFKRQESNREILKKISYFVENYPEFRFIQILWMLNLPFCNYSENGIKAVDRYYEESVDSLEKVDEAWKTYIKD